MKKAKNTVIKKVLTKKIVAKTTASKKTAVKLSADEREFFVLTGIKEKLKIENEKNFKKQKELNKYINSYVKTFQVSLMGKPEKEMGLPEGAVFVGGISKVAFESDEQNELSNRFSMLLMMISPLGEMLIGGFKKVETEFKNAKTFIANNPTKPRETLRVLIKLEILIEAEREKTGIIKNHLITMEKEADKIISEFDKIKGKSAKNKKSIN